MCVCECEYKSMKKQNIQRMYLFIHDNTLMAYIVFSFFLFFSFLAKPSSGRCLNFFFSYFQIYMPSDLFPFSLNYLLLESFSHQRYLLAFHWSLTNSKSPQVSKTLLSILAYLSNALLLLLLLLLLFTPCKFFITVLTGSLTQESGWQQIFSDFQDSSEHFNHNRWWPEGFFFNSYYTEV